MNVMLFINENDYSRVVCRTIKSEILQLKLNTMRISIQRFFKTLAMVNTVLTRCATVVNAQQSGGGIGPYIESSQPRVVRGADLHHDGPPMVGGYEIHFLNYKIRKVTWIPKVLFDFRSSCRFSLWSLS